MTLTIMSGLPASGKTTYTKTLPNTITIHRDEWRAAERERLGSSDYFPHGKHEYVYWAEHMASIIRDNPNANICIDQTTINEGAAYKVLINLLGRVPEIFTKDLTVRVISIWTPLDVCLERNAAREGAAHVPEDIIRSMSKHYHISQKRLRSICRSVPDMRDINIVVDYIDWRDLHDEV